MKSKEELEALKEEVDTLNKKLHELTREELSQVAVDWRAPVYHFDVELTEEEFAKVVGGQTVSKKKCTNPLCSDYGRLRDSDFGDNCPSCGERLLLFYYHLPDY